MFGSCATKLYLPFSDLDLVVVTGDHGKANEKNLVKKLAKELFANKSLYENIEAMRTAKIVAIVVTAINFLMVLRVIYVFSTIGYDGFMEQYEEIMRQMN